MGNVVPTNASNNNITQVTVPDPPHRLVPDLLPPVEGWGVALALGPSTTSLDDQHYRYNNNDVVNDDHQHDLVFRTGPGLIETPKASAVVKVRAKRTCGLFTSPLDAEGDGYLGYLYIGENSSSSSRRDAAAGIQGIVVDATGIRNAGEESYLSFSFGEDILQNSNIFSIRSGDNVATIHFCVEVGLFDETHHKTEQKRRKGYAEALFTYQMDMRTKSTSLKEFKTIQACSTTSNKKKKNQRDVVAAMTGARCVKSYSPDENKKRTSASATKKKKMKTMIRKGSPSSSFTTNARQPAIVPAHHHLTAHDVVQLHHQHQQEQRRAASTMNDIVFEFPKPTGTTSQFVHGLCVMGASTASASATCAGDTSVTYSIATEQSFGNGIKLWGDQAYVVDDGVTSTNQCMGGLYLRPSKHTLPTALFVDQVLGSQPEEFPTSQKMKDYLQISGRNVASKGTPDYLFDPHVVSFALIESSQSNEAGTYLAVLFNEPRNGGSDGEIALTVSGNVEGKLFHADSDNDDVSNYPKMTFKWGKSWADAFVLGPYNNADGETEVCTTITEIKYGLSNGARFVNSDGSATTLVDNANDLVGVPICIPINSQDQTRRRLNTNNHGCTITLTATPADPTGVTICGLAEYGNEERHGDWQTSLPALGFTASEPFAWGGQSQMKAYCSSDITAAPTPAPTPVPTPAPPPEMCFLVHDWEPYVAEENPDNENCNADYNTGGSRSCIDRDYPVCQGHVDGVTWGKCFSSNTFHNPNSVEDPTKPRCNGNHDTGSSFPCNDPNYPDCQGHVEGIAWGQCFSTGGTTRSRKLTFVAEKNPDNENCNADYNTGGRKSCIDRDYPVCQGHISGVRWGKCFSSNTFHNPNSVEDPTKPKCNGSHNTGSSFACNDPNYPDCQGHVEGIAWGQCFSTGASSKSTGDGLPGECCFCIVPPNDTYNTPPAPSRRHLRHLLPDHASPPVDWQQDSLPSSSSSSSSSIIRALAGEPTTKTFSQSPDGYAAGVCPQPCDRVNIPMSLTQT